MTDRAYLETTTVGIEEQFRAAWSDSALELIILPTEQCSFRCTYCYEDFSIGRMRPQTVEGIKNLLIRSTSRLKTLRIIWFGGEPLLATDIVVELSRFFTYIAQQHGIAYRANMTTNGYRLDASKASELADLGITGYQISLDGPKLYHDNTRLRADGSGTFDRIWSNLLEIRDSNAPVEILLRLHVTAENAEALPIFARDIRETFLHDPRFSVLTVPVGKLGGPNDKSISVIDSRSANAIISDITSILRGNSNSGNEAAHSKEPTGGKQIDLCYAAKPNAFVVRADGSIGKCTVALSSPRNAIGKLTANGDLEIDNGKHVTWIAGWLNMDIAALKCPAGIF